MPSSSANPRRTTIQSQLVTFLGDGQYVVPPLPLNGGIVEDEEHGWVLEFVIPGRSGSGVEMAVLIPLPELIKIGEYLTSGGTVVADG